MRLVFITISTLASLAAAAQHADMQWLIGTWTLQAKQGSIVESWTAEDDSTLVGRSVRIRSAGDSLVLETLRLEHRNGLWRYVSTVNGQNNNEPVAFVIIFSKGNEFIAQNPTHDFPQRIAYRRLGNMLFASIEGVLNGKFEKRNFDYQATGKRRQATKK